MVTGEIEVIADSVKILNTCSPTLPFQVGLLHLPMLAIDKFSSEIFCIGYIFLYLINIQSVPSTSL